MGPFDLSFFAGRIYKIRLRWSAFGCDSVSLNNLFQALGHLDIGGLSIVNWLLHGFQVALELNVTQVHAFATGAQSFHSGLVALLLLLY